MAKLLILTPGNKPHCKQKLYCCILHNTLQMPEKLKCKQKLKTILNSHQWLWLFKIFLSRSLKDLNLCDLINKYFQIFNFLKNEGNPSVRFNWSHTQSFVNTSPAEIDYFIFFFLIPSKRVKKLLKYVYVFIVLLEYKVSDMNTLVDSL